MIPDHVEDPERNEIYDGLPIRGGHVDKKREDRDPAPNDKKFSGRVTRSQSNAVGVPSIVFNSHGD
jgi:hypothetical protein